MLSCSPLVYNGKTFGVVITCEDITLYKHVESELRDSRDRLETIFQGVSDGIIVQNWESRILFVNKSVRKIFKEKIFNPLKDSYIYDLLDKYQFKFDNDEIVKYNHFPPIAAKKNKKYIEMNLSFNIANNNNIKKDNNQKFINIRSNPILNSNGSVLYIVNIITDITQKKKSEALIFESEKKYKTLMEALPQLVSVSDANGMPYYFNERWYQYTGLSFEESLDSITSDKIIHSEDKEKFISNWNKNFSLKNKFTQELRIKKKSGEYRWFLLIVLPIKNVKHNILMWISTYTDIDDQKRIENKLKINEHKFKQLVSRNIIGVAFWNFNGGVIEANDAFLNIVGFSRKDLENNYIDWNKVSPKEFDDTSYHSIEQMKTRGSSDPTERVLFTKSGSQVHVIIGSALLDETKQNGVSFILDITDRKNAEQKVKASLLEKETLLREIHHRVKNNLQIISSLLSLQSINIKDPTIKKILQESQSRIRSIALIHERLYQTKDMAHVDFDSYIKNLVSSLIISYGINQKLIQFDISIKSTSIPLDMGIPLGLIINEILSNSFKYAFPDQRKGKIFVFLKQLKKSIVLDIGDNGIGLPDTFNNQNTTSLGMQLIDILTRQLNGKFKINSNDGLKYNFILPIVEKIIL